MVIIRFDVATIQSCSGRVLKGQRHIAHTDAIDFPNQPPLKRFDHLIQRKPDALRATVDCQN